MASEDEYQQKRFFDNNEVFIDECDDMGLYCKWVKISKENKKDYNLGDENINKDIKD